MKNKRIDDKNKDISNEELLKKVALLEANITSLEKQNKHTIDAYEAKLKEAAMQYDHLLEQIALSRRSRFASKSEKTDSTQMSIFDEVELFSDYEEVEVVSEKNSEKKTVRKYKPKQFTLDESTLRVEQIIHDLSEDEIMGYRPMGSSSKKLLVFQPAEWYIEEHIYPKYVKELEDGSSDIISKDKVSGVFKGSCITSAALANIISDKYQYGLPLYRLESKFQSYGIHLSRQTLSNWCIQASDDYFDFLVSRMHHHLLKEDIIHADETTVKTLHHQDGSENKKSYMWVYRSGTYKQRRLLIYDYQPNRKAEHPITFLEGYKGYLQTDGYRVYDMISGITRVGCLAHARRKFVETKDVVSKTSETYKSITKIISLMNCIFKLEKKKKELSEESFTELRSTKIKATLDNLKENLIEHQAKALPNSNFGKAIEYSLKQFDSFMVVLEDTRLEFSNNAADRAVKPFVMGRKAWLFSNTTKGAKSSASLYSIVQSAKENGLHVERYLSYIMEEMKETTISSSDQFDDLLPNSENLPNFVYQNNKTKS